jgi:hypothetical protein
MGEGGGGRAKIKIEQENKREKNRALKILKKICAVTFQ